MNRPEPIELENNLGPDAVTGEINRVPWMAYDVDEMDLYIAEKDKEIAELKQKLMPCLNGDCILTCEVVEKYGKENAELKARIQLDDDEMAGFLQLEEECGSGDLRNYIAELKAENKRLKKCEIWMKQHFYCEEVIACESAKNRQLKRALWLARAMRAEAQWNRQLRDAGIAFAIGENKSWDSWNQKQKKWQGVERKCRAKAELYK